MKRILTILAISTLSATASVQAENITLNPVLVYTPDPRESRDYIPTYDEADRRREHGLRLNDREKTVLRKHDPPKPGSIAEITETRRKSKAATPTPTATPQGNNETELRLSREKLELEYQRKQLDLERRNNEPKKPRTGAIMLEVTTTSRNQRR